MPQWLLAQLGLLLIWLLFSSLIYKFNFWRFGNLFSTKDFFKAVFFVFFPLAWLVSSFLFGVYYFSIKLYEQQLVWPVTFLIVIPVLSIITYAYYMLKENRSLKRTIRNEKLEYEAKKREIYQWINNIPFLSIDMAEIKLYTSKGQTVGRLTLSYLTKEQVELIKKYHDDLPQGIFLEIIGGSDDGPDQVIH